MKQFLLVTWFKLDKIYKMSVLKFTQPSTETTPLTTMQKEIKPHGHARLFKQNDSFSHAIDKLNILRWKSLNINKFMLTHQTTFSHHKQKPISLG